jgi:hypothetical protein
MLAMVVQGCGGDDNGMEVEVPPPDDDDGVDPVTELEEVKKERDKYKKMLEDMEAEEAAMMASAKASAIFDALAANAGGAPSRSISAGSDGMLTVEVDGYKQVEDFGEADAIDGHRGAMLIEGSEMIVYTDIDDAEATPLGDVYNTKADPDGPTSYPIASGDDQDIMWGDVIRDSDSYNSMTEDAMTTRTFAGEVRDVMGMFSCTAAEGSPCSLPERQDNGKVVNADDAVQGTPGVNWVFIPTNAAAMVDEADEQYLYYGWWVNMTDDDPLTFDFEAFATANGYDAVVASGPGDTIEGSATYTGGAAGKYAMKSLTEDTVTGGHWTASAKLTANFDADLLPDTAGNDKNGVMVSGSIDDFMTGDTAQDWTVKLMVDGNTTDAGVQAVPVGGLDDVLDGATDRRVAEWDFGGSVDGMGNWSAAFHGPTATDEPTAITGEFNAMVDGFAQINGAFGANMMMEDAAMMAGN